MIVGTAGHIDHGKTALVKALTGVDADRLKEEKQRGITIDLGFAYLPVDGERIIGFIDVPGHERFVHTMLAGASGIDFALLVVSADDGIMPQTREHLAILDLLGVTRGIVALTKVDLADGDRRAAVTTDIRSALASTGLRDAAVLPVSIVSGEGIAALKAALMRAEPATAPASVDGRFRLAVDRCFTLVGVGTIVTGTVLSGAVAVGDKVVVSPSGLAARVRSIHAQNQPARRGLAGQRCALNLAGDAIAKDAIVRGDVVMEAALHAPTGRIDADFRLLPSELKPVGDNTVARLHHASAETGVRIVALGDPVPPGTTAKVQLVLDRPIAATVGDRFVLRDASAQRTIGGGHLLDLRAPARKRRTPERHAQLDALAEPEPAVALARLLAVVPFVDLALFARDHALSDLQVEDLCRRVAMVSVETASGTIALAPATMQRLAENLKAGLASFHREHPDMQGVGREALRRQTEPRLPPSPFLGILQREVRSGAVSMEGAFVRLPDHIVRLSARDEGLWDAVVPLILGEVRFRPPRVRDMAEALDRDEADIRRLFKAFARLGRVDEIAHDHFFARATTAEMVVIATQVAAEALDREFTAAAFRDRMDNGRKVAIQILDFFDRHGVTIRRGDLRRINPHRLDLFASSTPPTAEGGESFPVGRPDFKSGWGSEPVPGGFDSRSLPPGVP